MRVAIIDLGTNTFHLLIAKIEKNGDFSTLHRIRKYVYIGEEGVTTLGEKPLKRAYEALTEYKQVIDKYDVKSVTAFGTAALRTASNGKDFVEKIRTEIGIEIQTISGDKEADLIYLGTKQAVPISDENILIMDIGGGSVEFIIANQNNKIWAQSFPVGVSVLYNTFHQVEPISTKEKKNITDFLNQHFEPLYAALHENPAYILVGASGTFDVISGIMGSKITGYPNCESVDLTRFPAFYDEVIAANLETRLAMKTIPSERAKLIPVALVLIDVILKKAKINQMLVSAYAMKEGILWEMRHNG
jgi:exopolyphosphatase / guanosine-5'-triphosphate,3'-diphosphate pyrophosphatase